MIERDAEPIAHLHRSPYRPIEFGAHPSAARRQAEKAAEKPFVQLEAVNEFSNWKLNDEDWNLCP